MTSTQKFIEDALIGGYNKYRDYTFTSIRHIPSRNLVDLVEDHVGGTASTCVAYEEILLDPLAWQAVGKTKGWGNSIRPSTMTRHLYIEFFRHLADGKTIEEALSAIE
jgi:hypothetical protein